MPYGHGAERALLHRVFNECRQRTVIIMPETFILCRFQRKRFVCPWRENAMFWAQTIHVVQSNAQTVPMPKEKRTRNAKTATPRRVRVNQERRYCLSLFNWLHVEPHVSLVHSSLAFTPSRRINQNNNTGLVIVCLVVETSVVVIVCSLGFGLFRHAIRFRPIAKASFRPFAWFMVHFSPGSCHRRCSVRSTVWLNTTNNRLFTIAVRLAVRRLVIVCSIKNPPAMSCLGCRCPSFSVSSIVQLSGWGFSSGFVQFVH